MTMLEEVNKSIDALGASGSNLITLLMWSSNYNNNCVRHYPNGTVKKGMILAQSCIDEFMISKIQNFEWDFEQIRQELEFGNL